MEHKCQVEITTWSDIPGPWYDRACNQPATTNYSVLMTPQQTALLSQRVLNRYGEGWGYMPHIWLCDKHVELIKLALVEMNLDRIP
jgi:hypothetical protein